jgi:hypothetical protein
VCVEYLIIPIIYQVKLPHIIHISIKKTFPNASVGSFDSSFKMLSPCSSSSTIRLPMLRQASTMAELMAVFAFCLACASIFLSPGCNLNSYPTPLKYLQMTCCNFYARTNCAAVIALRICILRQLVQNRYNYLFCLILYSEVLA